MHRYSITEKDNTISYKGEIYQLLPSNGIKSYALRGVDVCERLDRSIQLLFENKVIPYIVPEKGEYTQPNE
ncbi:MAG: hypothetical protein ACUVUU_08365 [bacterium]